MATATSASLDLASGRLTIEDDGGGRREYAPAGGRRADRPEVVHVQITDQGTAVLLRRHDGQPELRQDAPGLPRSLWAVCPERKRPPGAIGPPLSWGEGGGWYAYEQA